MLKDALCNLWDSWDGTQMGIPFVLAPFVLWKMGSYRNVTPQVC